MSLSRRITLRLAVLFTRLTTGLRVTDAHNGLMMILLSLFPTGLLQVRDVLKNGYWHARSLDYLGGELPRLLEWLRLPGDLVFIFLGALPILIAVGLGYVSFWSERPQAGARRPAAVG
jgi:nitric oxide reductase large subunit